MEGLIKACKDSGCGWKCCDFGSNGHIVMLPTEYESANKSLSHLKVINDDNGGKHVKCIAKDKSNCDGGYKPIQCRTFPLFINMDRGSLYTQRSMRCPLSNDVLMLHKKRSLELVTDFCNSKDIDFNKFFKNVKLNYYLHFTGDFAYVILDGNNISDIMEYENSLNDENLCMRSTNDDIKKSIKSECSVGVLYEGRLIAYSLSYINEYGISFIDKCFVSEERRGSGLQEKMINLNLMLLKDKGSFVCYSMVSPKNTASLKNFEKCGFSITRKIVANNQERYCLENESFCE